MFLLFKTTRKRLPSDRKWIFDVGASLRNKSSRLLVTTRGRSCRRGRDPPTSRCDSGVLSCARFFFRRRRHAVST